MIHSRRYTLIVCLLLAGIPLCVRAQFKEEAFTQTYADENDSTARDSTDALFTFKEYFRGIKTHKDARIGVMFAGSTFFIGGQQMHNHDYWKLPVIYGGIGAGVGMGVVYRKKWQSTGDRSYQHLSNWFLTGAGIMYWASLMDGVADFRKGEYPQAGKATLYSLLLPGLGQIYNGEAWKIPIYYGFIMGSLHFLLTNDKNYRRYRWIYNAATSENSTYDGPVSSSTALYYRDVFRRYRDYSIVALVGFYVLQIIDANVFSYMQDFELTDDISMEVSPAVLSTDFACGVIYGNSTVPGTGMHFSSGQTNGIGVSMRLTF